MIDPADSPMADILFVASEPLKSAPPALSLDADTASAYALFLSGAHAGGELPASWIRLQPEDLVDPEQLRRQFLAFLETWPKSAGVAGRSFDELFTVNGGYSVWWTSVGADRQATHGLFKYFRVVALLDRAIAESAPKTILLLTRESAIATLVQSRAEHSHITVRLVPGSAAPARPAVEVSRRWLIHAVRHAVVNPFSKLRLALRCRWALRNAKLFCGSSRPTVVFASRFDRYLELRNGELSAVNWREICHALDAVEPGLSHAYLPRRLVDVSDVDASGRTCRRGVDAVRAARAPLLIREGFLPFRGHGSALARQVAAAWRFYRLTRRDDFRRSMRFANTDMSAVLLPDLQKAISKIADWSFRSAQFACALRAAGNVRALVVAEEMYRPSMPILAAASRLRIPTIGVQHGTLMPAHLIYTLPPGHVQHAPIPDYFAAYGVYAKETLSVHGSYPPDRVWITGAARLDPLVNKPSDQGVARRTLGLPDDRRVVVLATQTFPWFASAIRGVLESMRDHPGAVLCVKKHPSARAMSLESIDALAAEIGVAGVRGFTGDLELLLASSDVWISASSTTILEATLMGKTTICVNFSDEPDGYPYVEDGASLPARSVEELRHSLARALGSSRDTAFDERRTAFLRKHAGPTIDGRAALTLAREVVRLIHASPGSTTSGERRA